MRKNFEDMPTYKPRVISLTKSPGQTFGFYLRVEKNEEGHLIRCLEMGGPAELAGMRDGDRILRVNGTFVDGLPHSEVVELVRNGGASVTFHILDESSYKQAKSLGVNLSDPQSTPVANGAAKETPKPKLCYLVKSSSGFGFSLRSVRGEQGLFMTEVLPGGVADNAGVRNEDRLLEVNGENIENSTHDEVVEKIKLGGKNVMFLLVDKETDRLYRNKKAKIGAWSPTVKFLPQQPHFINMTKGPDGYGFLLREEPNQSGHFVKDIEKGSPAEKAGLREMDRVVAVNGKEVDSCSHDQVVDRIRQCSNKCCLLVVDKDTDQMYKQGKVSPMLFWEEMKDSNSPPSYTEALSLPGPVQPSPSVKDREEELKPKLCRMEKTPAGYGFHLNGVEGVHGQYIAEVVKGGAADVAGLENEDIVIEVNGENVEQSTHAEAVEMIRKSGNSLEMLVASRNVYKQLKAKGVTITPALLGETSRDEARIAETPEPNRKGGQETKKEEEVRPETPPQRERQRTPSTSSSSSEDSVDEKF
ncbi:Na(+)/H(+) exchange regulatory cofactor NHE-RF3 isoform X1 [Fundulus heteroclitus]|uniref:Na(+)/H(+) exchange regulatory cofactor NHE-RF3 isoform X1 n=2 Tax=Fundulus heteroclitus TaxID=8078 RepID=UPI00165C586F|nr:Na(+)/H(+) exchange regulatory cofactor NHE-RF3 isoform X1 [Fundulus heteroclitus]XP_035995080.1 Na(+)/H(+) exchange regulatory cofactor NHE-RF3 isoform X1 [Fundulus heteroclitus]